ncbi:prepilin-type N-terminal cleavage/methylation domain-containing protein [bacterium]|nr:prepilin-type N-terminal cleavage/methylation domain-containing protein [candidate division CSSED10-310 bacterium]
MNLKYSHGFSLVELLAVIGIFLVLSTISIIAWDSFGPLMILQGAAEGLGDTLELCMHKALAQKNEFFVMINYRERLYRTNDNITLQFPANSYVAVNDDGWLPTNTNKTRRYNHHSRFDGDKPEYREEYVPDAGDYANKWRDNNMIESREIFKGPLRIGRGIFFQPPTDVRDAPVRIVLSYRKPFMYWHGQNVPVNRPVYEAERREDAAYLYLSDHRYRPGDDTKDNKAHLRVIRIIEQKVDVYRPI